MVTGTVRAVQRPDRAPTRHTDPAAEVTATIASSSYEQLERRSVTVVVSTHGRSQFLAGLIAALEAQSLGSDLFEVVIVDDGSLDDTWSRLTEILENTSVAALALRLGQSVGQGSGRNVGVAHARAQVLAFTDDDCLPTPNWLENLTEAFLSEGPLGDKRVVVQGRTVPWPEDAVAGAWARTVWVVRPTWLFETCNIAYRKVDFDGAGGFAARQSTPTAASGKVVGEDAMLGWRVIEQGAGLLYNEEAVVHHRHLPASYGDWLWDQRGKVVFPELVSRNPLARRALWGKFFLASRTAAFDLAVVGCVLRLTTAHNRWLTLVGPWIWLALPEAAHREGKHPLVRLGQIALGDLIGVTSLAAGSVKSRALVV